MIFQHFSPSERKLFYASTVVAGVAGAILIFIGWGKITYAIPVSGGSFTEGVVGQPVFINPVISGSNDIDRDLISLTFCSLYDIAEKIETDSANKVWTIRLNDSVLWHDNTRLTSDDILFTLNRIQDPEYKSPQSSTWQGIEAERVSERELTLTLPAPFAFFEENLKKLYVIPKHIFADVPLANWRLSDYNLQPVGCGPFKFDSYKKKTDGFITKYSLVANPDYFGQIPYISNFNFLFYTDPAQAVEDFIFAKIDGLGNLNHRQLNLIKRNHELHSLLTPRYYSVFINQATHPALKSKNVRLALSTAVNRDLLVRDSLGGNAVSIEGPITPNFLPELNLLSSDPSTDLISKARDILEESGWKLYDSSVRANSDNDSAATLEFDLIVPELDFLIATANSLQNTWAQIGVKVNLVILSPEDINDQVIRDRNYQLLLFGNILGGSPDLFSFWHSSQKLAPGLNLSLYENSTADKLIESIRQNFSADERTSDLISLQTLIIRDLPAVFLYSPNYLYITSPDLQGFSDKLIVTPASRFDDVESWYLKTARKFK